MNSELPEWELRESLIENITEDKSQPRQDFDAVEDNPLVESVRDNGIIEPPSGYIEGDKIVLMSGTRRFRAAKAAGKKSITVRVAKRKPDQSELYLHQLLANAHRLDLNPMELCVAYMVLMRLMKINASELAKKVSKSKAYVSNVLSLDSLADEIKQLIRNGTIGLVKASMLARMTSEEQEAAVAELTDGTLSRDKLLRKSSKKKPKGEPVRRITLETPVATLSLVGKAKLSVDELIDLFQSLVRECRKARSQQLDLSTLACILRDRCVADGKEVSNGSQPQ